MISDVEKEKIRISALRVAKECTKRHVSVITLYELEHVIEIRRIPISKTRWLANDLTIQSCFSPKHDRTQNPNDYDIGLLFCKPDKRCLAPLFAIAHEVGHWCLFHLDQVNGTIASWRKEGPP